MSKPPTFQQNHRGAFVEKSQDGKRDIDNFNQYVYQKLPRRVSSI